MGKTNISISNIDKTAPTMVAPTASTTGWTNGNVTLTAKATDTASGISYYQWSTNSGLTASSGGWKSITNTKSQITQTYTATGNGTYYFYAKDAVGNVGKTSISISNIDKTAPTMVTPTASTTGWTNGNVTLTAKATDTASGISYYQWSTNSGLTASSGGWTSITNTKSQITQTYTATGNGTYYFYAKDASGNVGKTSISISNIDKTAPEISEFTAKASDTISTSATITVKAKDGLSGLSNLVLEWGTNTNYGNKKIETYIINGIGAKDLTTKTISLTGLGANTTYYVKITISDVSGNIKTTTSSFTTGKAIAETNTVLYTSIQNALNSINQGTVKVLSNTTENPHIDTGKTITLDLNSKTITGVLKNWGTTTVYGGNITENSESVGHAIENYNGKLTVKNGTYTGYYEGIYQCKEDGMTGTGETTIEGGYYYGNGPYGVGVAITQGSCLIKNGYFKGTGVGVAGWDYSPTITVQNGQFYGELDGIFANSGTLHIYGGYFEGLGKNKAYGCSTEGNTKLIEITGGTFKAYNTGLSIMNITNTKITGGSFSGKIWDGATFNGGNAEITGGTFYGGNYGIASYEGAKVRVKNGVTINGGNKAVYGDNITYYN